MNKLLTEFIGTFFLVTAIALGGSSPWAPFVIGSALMVMIYMGGPISGGHFNPAVTLAVWLRGKIAPPLALQYMLVQLVGAFAAALVAYLLRSAPIIVTDSVTGTIISKDIVRPLLVAPGHYAVWYTLGAEILFSFALCLVVLNVATAKISAGNSYFGLAIGFTVAVGAACVGSISGGAFNPAVGLGPNILAAIYCQHNKHTSLYIVGPALGAILAAIVFKAQHGNTAD
jgi:aquaporin Z